MKPLLLLIILFQSTTSIGQSDNRHSTIDFVQILNGNKTEALYYYHNNWEILRQMAIKKDYIEAYQILEAPIQGDEPFQLILITTYKDKDQYGLREEHFRELIKQKGPVKLMNDKKPGDFRKTLFNKEKVRHRN